VPRSFDLTPTQITHHPTQRIDPVPGRLPDIKPEDLINGFARAMKMLTGVDITSSTAFFVWLKEATGLDFVILGQLIDTINDMLGIDPDNPIDIQAAWAKIKQQHLDPISDFLTPDSPLNGANLFGLLDIPFVMLRNSNQELLENPTFFGELAVGNRRRWSHVTDVYREDKDPPGAETVVCNGELTALRSNLGKVAEGQRIVGEIHVLGSQVTAATPGADLMRLQLVSYLKGAKVGTPVTVGLSAFTLDPAAAGWVGAPNTALAGRMEVDWTVPAGVDEVLLRTELTANAASGRVWADSGSLQRGFNWYRVERDLQAILGILDGIASPDHWEDAYLGLKDLLSLVGIDTSGWVTSTAFAFWRDFNNHTTAIVRVFAHMGSVVAWENAWDGLRGLAGLVGIDTSAWPNDLDPGGLLITFATLVTAGNALFKDLGNKAKWTVAWNALTAFIDKLLGTGTITWPVLEPGGWFVDALGFVQNLIGQNGKDDLFPKGAGGVAGQVPTGLRYDALVDFGGQLPSGNLYYCVTAVVGGAETPASAEVFYFAAGFGTVGMKIKLEWNTFTGASQYKVYRRVRSNLAGDIETRLIATVVGTTYTDQTVRTGGSAATPPLSIDVAAQAAAEAAAEAAAAANNALVTTADTTVPNAPTWGFLQGLIAEVTAAANSVPYPGFLELPIFYYYTVTAVTAAGKESVASAEKMVMISPLCPAQVKVTWTASTTPSTTYRVYRRSSKTGATLRVASGVAGTTFTDTATSGTTVAKPGTTTAVAGSAVATAKSTAEAAQVAAVDASSAADAAQSTATNAIDAAALAAAKFNAVPESNIVVANVDPQVVPEDWGVQLLPIPSGANTIVSGTKVFANPSSAGMNGATNSVQLKLPPGFKCKMVLVFLASLSVAAYDLGTTYFTPTAYVPGGELTFSSVANKKYKEAGCSVFLAKNVDIPAGGSGASIYVGLQTDGRRIYTLDAWIVAIDGTPSGDFAVVTQDGQLTTLAASKDSVAIVHNSRLRGVVAATDPGSSAFSVSAPGAAVTHSVSNLNWVDTNSAKSQSVVVLTKNIDAAETLSISAASPPLGTSGYEVGLGVVIKSLDPPQTDTIGSYAEISTANPNAFTQTVGSFESFTQLIEVIRYSPDIQVNGATASFTVEYIGTYGVDVELLCGETHDMTLGIAINGTVVRARRCSGRSMSISAKVYAKQGDVISLQVKNHAAGNITLDTLSCMTVTLVNRSYL
jgi:hypothetical protein